MITAYSNATVSVKYRNLFDEASCVLRGYEPVRTFDPNKLYYTRNTNGNVFIKENITDIDSFAEKLSVGTLYTPTEAGPIENFNSATGITSLEEYFNWLPLLKEDKDGNPTKYTKLPLDEPYFEINANTRAIAIPNEFKKNGIAVQGDDLAEVVYFKIGRYFDAMDLNNTTIYIEWEAPKDKGGSVIYGISDTYFRDIESEPGYLIFGWAISEAITKNSGTLKFSVRFVNWDDPQKKERKIVYNFNTLTAQVTIHPGINLDLTSNIVPDNCNDRLLERIQYSEVVGSAAANPPYFLTNLILLEDGYDLNNHIDGSYELQVVATSTDTGFISYEWKRCELDENNKSAESWNPISKEEMEFGVKEVALSEEELEAFEYKLPEDHIYEIRTGDNTYDFLPLSYYDLNSESAQEYLNNTSCDEEKTIYEKRAVLVVTKYGEYKVVARNRIFNSLTPKDSNTIIFKRPEAIQGIGDPKFISTKHIIGTDSGILEPELVYSPGVMEYQWYKMNNSGEYESIDDANNLTFKPEEDGKYQLLACRYRNTAKTEALSKQYRVTGKPLSPTFATGTFDGVVPTVSRAALEEENAKGFEIRWNPNSEYSAFDKFIIKWYLCLKTKDSDTTGKDIELQTQYVDTIDENNICVTYFNPISAEEKIKENGYNIEGRYYAIIQTELNDTISDSKTEVPALDYMFTVVD